MASVGAIRFDIVADYAPMGKAMKRAEKDLVKNKKLADANNRSTARMNRASAAAGIGSGGRHLRRPRGGGMPGGIGGLAGMLKGIAPMVAAATAAAGALAVLARNATKTANALVEMDREARHNRRSIQRLQAERAARIDPLGRSATFMQGSLASRGVAITGEQVAAADQIAVSQQRLNDATAALGREMMEMISGPLTAFNEELTRAAKGLLDLGKWYKGLGGKKVGSVTPGGGQQGAIAAAGRDVKRLFEVMTGRGAQHFNKRGQFKSEFFAPARVTNERFQGRPSVKKDLGRMTSSQLAGGITAEAGSRQEFGFLVQRQRRKAQQAVDAQIKDKPEEIDLLRRIAIAAEQSAQRNIEQRGNLVEQARGGLQGVD